VPFDFDSLSTDFDGSSSVVGESESTQTIVFTGSLSPVEGVDNVGLCTARECSLFKAASMVPPTDWQVEGSWLLLPFSDRNEADDDPLELLLSSSLELLLVKDDGDDAKRSMFTMVMPLALSRFL